MANIHFAAENVAAPTTADEMRRLVMRRGVRALTLWGSNRQGAGNDTQGELLDECYVDTGIDGRDGAAAVVPGLHLSEGRLSWREVRLKWVHKSTRHRRE